MDTFGISGIGKIYAQYKEDILTEDDEVAILHEPEYRGCKLLTQAMVNIRATLASAKKNGIITADTEKYLLVTATEIFYQKRTFNELCKKAVANGGDCKVTEKLLRWIDQGNYVDQKKLDAIEALKFINYKTTETIKAAKTHDSLSKTMYLKALQQKISCKPYRTFKEWLPIQEKVVQTARLLGDTYITVKYLAHLLSMTYSLAITEYKLENNDPIFINAEINHNHQWHVINDINRHYASGFTIRNKFISKYHYDSNVNITPESINVNVINLMKIFSIYPTYKKLIGRKHSKNKQQILDIFKLDQPCYYNTLFYMAYLLEVIVSHCEGIQIKPTKDTLLRCMKMFSTQNKINSRESFETWLNSNDLGHSQFIDLMELVFYFDYFAIKNNCDVIKSYCKDDSIWWILDALYLSGYYTEAKAILNNPQTFKTAVDNIYSTIKQKGTQYTHALDFDGGEQEFENFVNQLTNRLSTVSNRETMLSKE